jgi:proline dehydrogenase
MNILSFDNTQIAFASKSDADLAKANFLFSCMNIPLLVKWGTRIAPWAIKVGLPVKGIIRATIFKQFVGGETLEETADLVQHLASYNVQVILDYGAEGGEEGEKAFDLAKDEFVKVVAYAATQPNIPFISIKVTGIASFALLEKMNALMAGEGDQMQRYHFALSQLDDASLLAWNNVVERVQAICSIAATHKVGVLVDAEESWIQEPVDALTTSMMEMYNLTAPIVYNTIQLYRHDKLSYVKALSEYAAFKQFILGVKLVRGAYMEKERQKAVDNQTLSPIQPSKNATDTDYNAAVDYCLEHIHRIAVIIATHNEESNLLATQWMQRDGIALNHPHIHFSQLYGMSDNITFNLAKAGCNVSKYLPFGPIEDVIPYLMRRAQENSSVAGQTNRELTLIRNEKNRRKQSSK